MVLKVNDLIVPGAIIGGLFIFKDDISNFLGGFATATQGIGSGLGTAGEGLGAGLGAIGTGTEKVINTTTERFEQITSPAQIIQVTSEGRSNIIEENFSGQLDRLMELNKARLSSQSEVGSIQGETDIKVIKNVSETRERISDIPNIVLDIFSAGFTGTPNETSQSLSPIKTLSTLSKVASVITNPIGSVSKVFANIFKK